jgi:hypothetical protein
MDLVVAPRIRKREAKRRRKLFRSEKYRSLFQDGIYNIWSCYSEVRLLVVCVS